MSTSRSERIASFESVHSAALSAFMPRSYLGCRARERCGEHLHARQVISGNQHALIPGLPSSTPLGPTLASVFGVRPSYLMREVIMEMMQPHSGTLRGDDCNHTQAHAQGATRALKWGVTQWGLTQWGMPQWGF